jgi:hypothetical protein
LDPEKDLKYGIPRHSVKKILSFVQDYGTFTEESSFTNRESYPRYVLTGADLLRFTKSSDTTVSNPANWLNSYIESNKPLLLKHEKELLNNIGAATRDNCSEIVYYVDTGRVSVLFHAATKSLDDGMVVALVAPPDDKRKRMRVVEWVQSDPERHQRISSELLAKGFQISLDWKR